MKLKNTFYQIIISDDKSYKIGSLKNRYYDIEFNPQNYTKEDLYKVLCIDVKGKHSYRFSLVGDCYTNLEKCAVLEGSKLVILQNWDLYVFDLERRDIAEYHNVDNTGCNFGIYKTSDGYIIYGEIEIQKLDFNFNQVWSFSGKDIFVSITGRKSFEIDGNTIRLYDFQDNYYVLDFNGNEV